MRKFTGIIFTVFLALTFVVSVTAKAPRVFLYDAQKLEQVKKKVKAGDKAYSAAIERLERDAKAAMKAGPFTVMSKTALPPSGDKHDYMSQAPYFWADPKKADGLPYINRDGVRNPEINKLTDASEMGKMMSAVETLGLAYYMKGDEAYAAKAVELLRVWFLNADTKMNPNLDYGQGIPGIATGRGYGLIETRWLPRTVDAIGMLEGSKALTKKDKDGLKDWFAKFLQWMQDSKIGKEEAATKNNHVTYYDLQLASYALFAGQKDLAKRVLENAKQKRIAIQIEPDGSQPHELRRTKSWSYSVMNLDGFMSLADLGRSVDIDLWNFQSPDGRSIRRATEFLAPYTDGKNWKHQQIEGWPSNILFPLMRRASARFTDAKFSALTAAVPAADPASREMLLYSK